MVNVTTGEFYGPFDLLLQLIRKSKYDIYEVNISEITNDYLQTIQNIDIPTDEVADFILIATQLLYIKTKSLIKDTLENDEDEEDFISEDELKQRLQEYKRIKSIIPKLRSLEEEGLKKHVKLQEDLSIYKDENNEIIYDVQRLKFVLEELISQFLSEDEFKVEKILNIEEYSLEKYTLDIKLQLIEEKMISISHMLKKVENKSEAIIIFLSILELSKTNNLSIIQDVDSLEISIKLKEKCEGVDNG